MYIYIYVYVYIYIYVYVYIHIYIYNYISYSKTMKTKNTILLKIWPKTHQVLFLGLKKKTAQIHDGVFLMVFDDFLNSVVSIQRLDIREFKGSLREFMGYMINPLIFVSLGTPTTLPLEQENGR